MAWQLIQLDRATVLASQEIGSIRIDKFQMLGAAFVTRHKLVLVIVFVITELLLHGLAFSNR